MNKFFVFLVILLSVGVVSGADIDYDAKISALEKQVNELNRKLSNNDNSYAADSFAAPDYSSSSSFKVVINGEAYTVAEDGYIQISYLPDATRIFINSSQVAPAIPVHIDWAGNGISPLFPVKQGDVVTITGDRASGEANGKHYKIR